MYAETYAFKNNVWPKRKKKINPGAPRKKKKGKLFKTSSGVCSVPRGCPQDCHCEDVHRTVTLHLAVALKGSGCAVANTPPQLIFLCDEDSQWQVLVGHRLAEQDRGKPGTSGRWTSLAKGQRRGMWEMSLSHDEAELRISVTDEATLLIFSSWMILIQW